MNKEKSIEACNMLIEINNDRIEGYETASRETFEVDLKLLFSQCQQASEKFITALIEEVYKLGGTPLQGTKTSGKLYRLWMDMKAAFIVNNRKVILDSCEYGENVALDIYENALENNFDHFTSAQHDLISNQKIAIRTALNDIKNLQNTLLT